MEWLTDCQSLHDHGKQAGLHIVSDKYLVIDLCGLRQMLWRVPREAVEDPLAINRLPANGNTRLTWTSTDKTLVDPLTKGMKHAGLRQLISAEVVDLN